VLREIARPTTPPAGHSAPTTKAQQKQPLAPIYIQ
jgi:hypothetical protein